jgi:hypothetical protein
VYGWNLLWALEADVEDDPDAPGLRLVKGHVWSLPPDSALARKLQPDAPPESYDGGEYAGDPDYDPLDPRGPRRRGRRTVVRAGDKEAKKAVAAFFAQHIENSA